MSETRSLTATSSFTESQSTSTVSRPLKRRHTSATDLTFFTPAADSFDPVPYNPHDLPLPKPRPQTRHSTPSSLAIPTPVMDPSPSDPSAAFIHPPFNAFPDARLYPDGLTYAVMATNPEWFLVADDFITTDSSAPNRIPYPYFLEPPRGWCPAKKKDLKERGSHGWPEGEEPRLRCTFCRRTYAGVNAKSMWRRHVFEKHKVAMANRRDGHDRTRGRGSTKENRQRAPLSSKENSGLNGRIVLDVVVQTTSGNPAKTSSNRKFRSLIPADGACAKAALAARVERSRVSLTSAPVIPQEEFRPVNPGLALHQQAGSINVTPPQTPRPQCTEDHNESQSPTIAPSKLVHESPYDPLSTPAFHHSPARLPSDQPWRFPSPSHPLHSKACELSLSMVAQGINTPSLKGAAVSPGTLITMDMSPLSTPSRKIVPTFRPSPLNLYPKTQPPLVETERMARLMLEDSPLRGVSKRLRTPSELDSWMYQPTSPSPLNLARSGSVSEAIALELADMYFPWVDEASATNDSPASSPEVESPVLRSAVLPEFGPFVDKSGFVGLGLGLREPARSPDANDPYGGLRYLIGEDELDEVEVGYSLSSAFTGPRCTPNSSPVRKRRRTTDALR